MKLTYFSIPTITQSIGLGMLLASVAQSDTPQAGQVSWESGVASFSETLCGFSGDDFIISARTEGVRLRISFMGDGDLDSIDFADPSSVRLSFRDTHMLSGLDFAMYKSLGSMGDITASDGAATGQLHLRPASAQALDDRADGLQVAYDLHCTGVIF
ncbi:hypothetical protein [Yoonia sp.]|uniref:hypothetical protein n=1 Tax=Yoonia sp. TaxID=2212373 RepID=UPI003A4D4831